MELLVSFQEQKYGLAIASDNTIYIANYTDSIDKVSYLSSQISITKGTNELHTYYPSDLAFDKNGNLFIACEGIILKKPPNGKISPFAGNGTDRDHKDGNGENAHLSFPYGFTFDDAGFAYFSDYIAHCIRKVSPDGKVTTLCGKPTNKGFVDGKGDKARFSSPLRMAYDKYSKRLYVADTDNNRIRTITLEGNVGTLCMCQGEPRAVAVDSQGKIFVVIKRRDKLELAEVDEKGNIKYIKTKEISGFTARLAFDNMGNLFILSTDNTSSLYLYPRAQAPVQVPTPVHIAPVLTTPVLLDSTGKSETSGSSNGLSILGVSFVVVEDGEIEELRKWLQDLKLGHLFPVVRELGVSNVGFVEYLQESDFGPNIKPVEKRVLFAAIQKLKDKNSSQQSMPSNNITL